MKYFYLISVILLCSVLGFSQSNQRSKIISLINSVSVNNLKNTVKQLENAGGFRSRVNFTPGNDSAAVYIYNEFKKIKGLSSLYYDTFYITSATPPFNTKPLTNIVATIKGVSDTTKHIVIGAHYDCSGSRMPGTMWQDQWQTMEVPGADDNATGVATILEMARLLTDTTINFKPAFTIDLIAFGAEESGPAYTGSHHGSISYATKAKQRNENILAMISVDMIGYNNSYHYQSIVANTASRWLGSKLYDNNSSFSIGLVTNQYPFINATYSDHASFWDQNYSAVLLIENAPPWNSNNYYKANPLYHTSYDTLGSLNFTLVTKVVKLTLATTCTLVDSITTNIDEDNFVAGNYKLEQNYPNPFNPTTTIEYFNSSKNFVTLKIYDVLGNEVETLVNEVQSPGKYSLSWNAAKYSSGIYYYEFKSGEFRAIRKMMLLK